MAMENITKFFDAAMTDKVLAEKIAALAVENGYNLTAEELLESGVARPLSEDEAERATGGSRHLSWGPISPDKIPYAPQKWQ